MTRPPPEVVTLIDNLVARLDARTIEEPYDAPATSSYAVIMLLKQDAEAARDKVQKKLDDASKAHALQVSQPNPTSTASNIIGT